MPHKVNHCFICIKRDGVFDGVGRGTKSNTTRRVIDQVESDDSWGFAEVGLDPSGRTYVSSSKETTENRHHSRV